jgi:hypothetical protein
MSNSSDLLKTPLASLYFKPTSEGQIFTSPPPWIWGKQREYQLSNAQAERLVSRLSRAYVLGMLGISAIMITGIVAAVGLVYMLAGNPDQIFAQHPIAYVSAVVVATILLIGTYTGYIYRTAATELVGLSWTIAQQQPYSLEANLKKTIAIETMLPTWVLAIFVIVFLIGIPLSGVPAIKALASGRLIFDLFQAGFFLIMAIMTSAALIAKLKGRRAAK